MFRVLGMAGEYLTSPHALWRNVDYYKEMCRFALSLKVTNDTAERAVQLVDQFAHSLTKSSPYRYCLLQCVENHRKNFLSFSKATLNKM